MAWAESLNSIRKYQSIGNGPVAPNQFVSLHPAIALEEKVSKAREVLGFPRLLTKPGLVKLFGGRVQHFHQGHRNG